MIKRDRWTFVELNNNFSVKNCVHTVVCLNYNIQIAYQQFSLTIVYHNNMSVDDQHCIVYIIYNAYRCIWHFRFIMVYSPNRSPGWLMKWHDTVLHNVPHVRLAREPYVRIRVSHPLLPINACCRIIYRMAIHNTRSPSSRLLYWDYTRFSFVQKSLSRSFSMSYYYYV